MKDSDKVTAATACELMPDVASRSSHGAGTEFEDGAHARMRSRARALRLGQLLGLHVSVDETGWLHGEVELVYKRERRSTIRPIMVRVGREAHDEDVLGHAGVWGSCCRYNDALDRLHQLAVRMETMIRDARVRLVPGSPLEYAHRQLSRLDQLILARQVKHMGHAVVRLGPLAAEAEFFERCDAQLAPILLAAEAAASRIEQPNRSRPRTASRWPRWLPWSHRRSSKEPQ